MLFRSLFRVVGDLHGFGVAGAARADHLVAGGRFVAACVARYGVEDALGVLEHGLHAPEAAAGEHGCGAARLGACLCGGRYIYGRGGQFDGFFFC